MFVSESLEFISCHLTCWTPQCLCSLIVNSMGDENPTCLMPCGILVKSQCWVHLANLTPSSLLTILLITVITQSYSPPSPPTSSIKRHLHGKNIFSFFYGISHFILTLFFSFWLLPSLVLMGFGTVKYGFHPLMPTGNPQQHTSPQPRACPQRQETNHPNSTN